MSAVKKKIQNKKAEINKRIVRLKTIRLIFHITRYIPMPDQE